MRKILPPVILNRSDFLRLHALTAMNAAPSEAVALLEQELGRAEVVTDDRFPARIVALNSRVTFRDLLSGEQKTVTLVLPDKADEARGRISVLSRLGAALIGLREGQVIAWETWDEGECMLMAVQVHEPEAPESRSPERWR